jgi:hypothetical protein
MRARARAAITRLLDWPVRRLLRRCGLLDIPEVRRPLRAAGQKGFTFGAAPSHQKMRAIREQAVKAVLRATPDEDAPSDSGPLPTKVTSELVGPD